MPKDEAPIGLFTTLLRLMTRNRLITIIDKKSTLCLHTIFLNKLVPTKWQNIKIPVERIKLSFSTQKNSVFFTNANTVLLYDG